MIKKNASERRKIRVRSKIIGTKARPRLSVFRSNRYLWAQLIDDDIGQTLGSFSSRSLSLEKKTTKTQTAHLSGKAMAEKLIALKVKKIVFDRGPCKYKGRVKAFADGLREGGVIF